MKITLNLFLTAINGIEYDQKPNIFSKIKTTRNNPADKDTLMQLTLIGSFFTKKPFGKNMKP